MKGKKKYIRVGGKLVKGWMNTLPSRKENHDAGGATGGAAKRFFRASAAWRSFSRLSDLGLLLFDFVLVFSSGLPLTLPLVVVVVVLSALRPCSLLLRSPPRFRPPPVLLPSLGPFPRWPLASLRPRLLSDRAPTSSAPRPLFVPRSGKARSNAAITLSPSVGPNFFARSRAFCFSASALLSSDPLTPASGIPKRAARAARLASSALRSVDGRFDVYVSVVEEGAGAVVGTGVTAVFLGLDGEAGADFVAAGAETVRSWVLDGSMAGT